MSVPTFDQFIFPLLQVLAKAPNGLRAAEAHERVAEHVQLSPEARSIRLSSGQRVYQNRIGWAHDRLKRADLSETPRRGLWQITAKGRDFLGTHPQSIDEATLREIATVKPASQNEDASTATSPELPPVASPEEQLDEAVRQINESLAAELLDLIHENSPDFFEGLVLELLLAMGYGASHEDVQKVGGVGDGGIDGIISLDKLGLEKVYVQAKRWRGSSVGSSDIRNFAGALLEHDLKKGVFITTSSFSPNAERYARNVGITLISGGRLAKLMIEHGVGVSVQRTIRVCKVDSDYFEPS